MEQRIIDARRSSIYFFSVLFLMYISIFLMLIFPTFPYWEQAQYIHFYLLIPIVLIKVFLPKTKFAKWLATTVTIHKFK